MKILIEVDEQTARELEAVAPGRKRRRSEFIRYAIRRALAERAQEQIEAGYRKIPDEPTGPPDPRVWGEWSPAPVRRKGAKRKRA